MIETVTVPGVTPEEGVTFNQLAFEVTEKLPVALLSIRNVWEGGAAALGTCEKDNAEGVAVTAAPEMVKVTGTVTGEVPPSMVTAA